VKPKSPPVSNAQPTSRPGFVDPRIHRLVKRRPVAGVKKLSIERVGFPKYFLSDYFYRFMNGQWWILALSVVIFLFVSNLVFACLYLLAGDGIEHAQAGSFLDAFFFSVQTMSTLGYGILYPKTILVNFIAAVEAFYGMLSFAVAAGLIFAKFSRPTAKIVFSEAALISIRGGQRCLIFRMVNERHNQILEASLSVNLLRTETTLEGDVIRTFLNMDLIRGRTPVFALTWTAIHIIDERSPLYGETIESLDEKEIEIIISFTGLDESYGQNIHARHSYILDELRWDHRFMDILSVGQNGQRIIDYSKFHKSVPLPLFD
jgi:inward rectifier potassium channel